MKQRIAEISGILFGLFVFSYVMYSYMSYENLKRDKLKCALQSRNAASRLLRRMNDEGIDTSKFIGLVSSEELLKDYHSTSGYEPLYDSFGDPYRKPLHSMMTYEYQSDRTATVPVGDLLILNISDGNLVLALGPDEERSLPELTGKETFSDIRKYCYDPTNGVYSAGDVIGFYEVTGNS